jgi:hypothetical protein
VSHLKQRIEQNCLNCNAVVKGRYCSVCGQENLEPQESIWHLIVHFFNDITHFDGKFFSSVKYVFTKPGFLTAEYVAGRRMAYSNPVRFYVFTSFIFFLIFFTFIVDEEKFKIGEDKKTELSKKNPDKVDGVLNNVGIDSLRKLEIKNKKPKNFTFVSDNAYRDKKQYDSLKKLGLTKESGLKRLIVERDFKIQEKYGYDKNKTLTALINNLLHSIPQTLFFTLPLFALVLQLLYIRQRKFYYVAHVIFTIHLYIFIYIDLLLIYFLGILSEIKYLGWLSKIEFILGLGIFYYAYRAMRSFYEQGRWKTLFKLIILCFALLFLSVIFAFFAFALSIYKL